MRPQAVGIRARVRRRMPRHRQQTHLRLQARQPCQHLGRGRPASGTRYWRGSKQTLLLLKADMVTSAARCFPRHQRHRRRHGRDASHNPGAFNPRSLQVYAREALAAERDYTLKTIEIDGCGPQWATYNPQKCKKRRIFKSSAFK